jgi:nucleoid DNA-binding protein
MKSTSTLTTRIGSAFATKMKVRNETPFLVSEKYFWSTAPVEDEVIEPVNKPTSKENVLTRKDMSTIIAEDHEITIAKADRIVKSVFDIISDQVATKKEKVAIAGFGTFKPVNRDARTARNPITGEKIHVPAKVAVKFTASSVFKGLCNSK